MRHFFTTNSQKTIRFLEIFIPSLSWILITMPLWLSFYHPALVAYLIITFDVYWFYKSFTLALHAIQSFVTMNAHVKIDWLTMAKTQPNYKDLNHVIIIPEYHEPIHILRRTLENLVKQDFPKNKIIVVLATESKDPDASVTSMALRREFEPKFGKFLVTRHTLRAGETAGKSSNMAWAARQVVSRLKTLNIPLDFVTITSCDADALLHPKYFSYLGYLFLSDVERAYHFYQGAILFYNNIWRIPLPSRVVNTMFSISNLAILSQKNKLINFSTYSLSLATAVKAGFWGIDVIPEDYHMFFKVYFTLGEKVKTKSIFLPILLDSAESYGFWRTMVNQYEQSKRWAWGISDVPFVVQNAFVHNEIPAIDRFRRVMQLLEQHVFWSSNWFILTIGSILPPLVNPAFGRTVLGHNLSQLSSGILTLSMTFLLVIIILDWRIKPIRPKEFAAWKLPFLYIQWLTVPFVSFFLSALPGLDAHTRMIFGKRLEYRVTEKV
jgi:cellulose synthase/poly-beta-1,6-N-acetylglucosamine synthase-like glycosyltransferase